METSAINANTILVTFEGIEEPVEIELEEALVHGQTKVTFVYNEVEYTAELDEPFVDPEVVELEEAIAAAEEAIANLSEDITLDDAEAVEEARALVDAAVALGAVEEEIEGIEILVAAEAKIAELEAALRVENVKAETDNKTKVTTVSAEVFNLEDEAKAVITLKYDEELELEDLVIEDVDIDEDGNIEYEFEIVIQEGTHVVEVTVEEVTGSYEFTVDFKEVDAIVEKVNKADTQIKLWEALEVINEKYDGVAILDNIVKYAGELGNEYATIAEINAAVKAINDAGATTKLLEKIVGEDNQFELLELLEVNFDAVDADLIGNYQAAIRTEGVTLAELEDVQNLIFFVNADHAVGSLVKTKDENWNITELEDITQADIDAAQELIDVLEDGYELVAGTVTKAGLQSALDAVQGLFDANNALKTATSAVEALFIDVEAEDKALAPKVNQDIIDAAQELVTDLPNGDEKDALQVLINDAQELLDRANYEIVENAVNTLFVLDEEGEIVEPKALAVGVTQQDILDAKALVEDLGELDTDGLLAGLIDEAVLIMATDAVEALVDEEGKLLADQDAIDAAQELVTALPDDDEGGDTTKADLQDLIDAAQELLDTAAINAAIQDNDAAALQAIIVDMNIESYIALSRAQRGELVQFIIDKAAADEYVPVESTDAFKTSIEGADGEVAKYLAAIATVNKADEKAAMQTALEEVYDLYNKLTAVQKLDVAEEMVNLKAAEDYEDYTTFAEIRATVDAVIAELGY